MTTTPESASRAPVFGAEKSGAPQDAPALSVVVPMFNEDGAAADLVDEISAALGGVEHEIVVVDDCSEDGTKAALVAAAAEHPQLRVIAHGANAGQSRAIRTGVLAACAPVIATLDGDGQNDPRDIYGLYAQLMRAGAPPVLAMVAGERRGRRDSSAKRLGSRFANAVRRRLLNDGAVDTGCGLKVFRREAYLRLPYFDHQHRYLPALMRREGFLVEFQPVRHRARRHGRSKYTNLGRLAVAIRDLLGVMWLKSRARSPGTISEVQADPACDMVKTDR